MEKGYAHPYQKLGGWLLLIVIFTFIFAFSGLIGSFSQDGFFRSWPGYAGGEFWLQLMIQCCTFYTATLQVTYAVMLIKRDPRFARTWQLIYIGSFLKALLTMTIHLGYGFPMVPSGYSPSLTTAIGLSGDIAVFLALALGLFLFTLYFKKSVRLRTYMGSDRYLRLAFFTRKADSPLPMVPDAPADREE